MITKCRCIENEIIYSYSENVRCFKDKNEKMNCHLSIGDSEAWKLEKYEL